MVVCLQLYRSFVSFIKSCALCVVCFLTLMLLMSQNWNCAFGYWHLLMLLWFKVFWCSTTPSSVRLWECLLLWDSFQMFIFKRSCSSGWSLGLWVLLPCFPLPHVLLNSSSLVVLGMAIDFFKLHSDSICSCTHAQVLVVWCSGSCWTDLVHTEPRVENTGGGPPDWIIVQVTFSSDVLDPCQFRS